MRFEIDDDARIKQEDGFTMVLVQEDPEVWVKLVDVLDQILTEELGKPSQSNTSETD